ncbi:MAG: PKD domain-containing protein, partial [Halovenus sp.]
MKCRRVVILLVVCLGVTAGTVGVATGTAEEPLADAGLDQSVKQGTTVYLDAGGSVSPDSEIVGFEWEIERPDGTTTTPACRSCERTNFQPTETGVYNATVTVTDEEGRSATDTLRVTVTESEPPEVTISGPEIVLVGDRPTINLTASAGDEPLSSLTWFVDGQQYDATFVDGNLTTDAVTPAVNEPGKVVVEARVTDQRGRSKIDEHNFTVEDGQFGVNNGTVRTRSSEYDLDSLAVEFTGSTSGLESTPTGDKWIRAGKRFGYSIGLRTYEETTGKTVINHPFTQSTAEFPHLVFDNDPHEYGWWGENQRVSRRS